MMDQIYTVKAIQQMFGFKDARTARKIMREMEHTENPLLPRDRQASRLHLLHALWLAAAVTKSWQQS